MTLDHLNTNFAIPGVLAFDTHGELLLARITSPACTAELYLQGAHVTAFQPAGEAPVLFLSERSNFAPGKAIRGGIPVIWPWFGSRSGARSDGPMHGFARTADWTLVTVLQSGDDLHFTLALGPSEATRALGYDHFRLLYQVTLGSSLRLRLTVVNEADTPLHFEEAFHTYLHVSAADDLALTGLAGTGYLDKTDNFARKTQPTDPLILTGPTDRPYLNTTATVSLHDPGLSRTLTVAKQNSLSTVIWSPFPGLSASLKDMAPESWRSMTCIETANVADNAITLAPRSAHTMEAHISVRPQA